MAVVAPSRVCPLCDQPLDNQAAQCAACGANEDWLDLAEGYGFVQRRFQDWHDKGRMTAAQWERIQAHYHDVQQQMRDAVRTGQPVLKGIGLPPRDQCWSCREHLAEPEPRCPDCGVILQSPGVRSLRYWKLLSREIQAHLDRGRLTLVQAHEFDSEVRERMAALRGRLEQDRVRTEPRTTAKPPPIPVPRRSLLEILLDPQSIQWLLGSGGALLVVGLVIWLASLGLFKDPLVIAVALGLGNALFLAGGFALIRFTRFQTAGRALTLLACLVMPLNLWFYHAQNLITVQGHLWVAGLVCCAIYAASALILRDSLFVYVLCGGIALTGLLLLGELGRFDEILAPTTMLMILGLGALHLERIFPDIDSPFSRKRFGMAFFWSAQALLGAGLLLLLGGQLTGVLRLHDMFGIAEPLVARHDYLVWTILLTLAGTYAYLWSDFAVRQIGVYIYFAAITLLWTEIQALALVDVPHKEPIIIVALALTALAVNVLYASLGKDKPFARAVPPLGLALTLVPVAYGVLLHFRATNLALQAGWPFEITYSYVAAMVIAALSCRAGAYFYRHAAPTLTMLYFFTTAASTFVAAAGLAWLLGFQAWEMQAPLLMLIPIAYIIAARLYRGHTPEEPLVWVAHASTVLMLVCSLYAALRITSQMVEPIAGTTQNLLYALFCAEAAIFYGLAASFRKETWNVYLATILFCGALWQLLVYWHTPTEYYTVIFALTGTALLVVYRLAVLESTTWSGLATAAFQSANGLLSLGFLSGALLTLSRLVMNEQELQQLAQGGPWQGPIHTLMFTLVLLGLLGLTSCLLVRHPGWRRFYFVLAIVDALLIFACIHKLSLLSPWEKLEIFSLALGALLLVIGLIGWYRETERENDLVSFSLVIGCLLASVPLVIAVIAHRVHQPSPLNEFGLVLSGVLLLGTGIMCRLRANTLIGGCALGAYVLIVIVDLHRFLNESVIVGIYLTAGGGLLFATGLFLSLYRDRLLTLPDRIKRREGIFKVLSWR